MPPAMRVSADRVAVMLPSSKPWYPRFLRVMGILIWVLLLSFAYMVYKF